MNITVYINDDNEWGATYPDGSRGFLVSRYAVPGHDQALQLAWGTWLHECQQAYAAHHQRPAVRR